MSFNTGGGFTSWEAFANSKQLTIATPDGTKTITGQFKDDAGNILTGADTITLDQTAPTVSTGYIAIGNTGQNGDTEYYNGTINIKANVADIGAGLNGTTCQYTT